MMVKKQRIPASEIKGVRTFGGDSELVIITEGTPLATVKRQVEAAAKDPAVNGILLDMAKK